MQKKLEKGSKWKE